MENDTLWNYNKPKKPEMRFSGLEQYKKDWL